MKIGRVSFSGQVFLAVINEKLKRVSLIGGEYALYDNPVMAVIDNGVDESKLMASVIEEIGFDDVEFLSPFASLQRNVFAVGKNYHAHAAEFDKSGFNATSGNDAIPKYPQFFTKATTSLTGPLSDIVVPASVTSAVDYEGEIGVVIGTGGKNIRLDDAQSHIFGFVALNDVTARDLQKNHAQWFLGKSLDTFCPMGPWIETEDTAAGEGMRVETWVNGEKRQDALLSDLIFSVPELISTLSAAVTLLPGDIISTGTPVGVGIGFSPAKFLKDGDVVKVSVTGLGTLENKVVII